jgi:hypothetical protein
MPNYVTNQVRASKEVIDSMIQTEPGHGWENAVDFNLIIPTPDNIFQGNLGTKERELYGENNWYDWNTKNWGTKWNAGDTTRPSEKSVYFETAWERPEPVFLELSRKFPKEKILIRFADESFDRYSGSYYLLNGEVIEDPRDPSLKSHESIVRFRWKLHNRKYA